MNIYIKRDRRCLCDKRHYSMCNSYICPILPLVHIVHIYIYIYICTQTLHCFRAIISVTDFDIDCDHRRKIRNLTSWLHAIPCLIYPYRLGLLFLHWTMPVKWPLLMGKIIGRYPTITVTPHEQHGVPHYRFPLTPHKGPVMGLLPDT